MCSQLRCSSFDPKFSAEGDGDGFYWIKSNSFTTTTTAIITARISFFDSLPVIIACDGVGGVLGGIITATISRADSHSDNSSA